MSNRDDDDTLTPAQAARVQRMIHQAATAAHVGAEDGLQILAAIARGDRAGAERIRHRALMTAMMRELQAMLDHGGPPTHQ